MGGYDRVESVERNDVRYAERDDVVVRPYKGGDEQVWNKTVQEKKYDKQKDDMRKKVTHPKNCRATTLGWFLCR